MRWPIHGREGHLAQGGLGPYASRVRSEECRQEPDVEAHAVGWVACLVDLADDPGEPEVIVYCPACAAREFGNPFPSERK